MAGTANAGASSAGTSSGDGVKEQAQDKAQQVKEQAGEQLSQARGQARDRVREQVDQRSTQLGEQVGQQAGDLRTVAQQLQEQGKDGPARIAHQVADRVESAGSWMRDSDADRILGDIEDFARSKPWAVAAGGLVLGFMASRLLKASSSERYEYRRTAGALPPAGRSTASYRPPATTVPPPRTAPPVDQPLSTPPPVTPAGRDPLAPGAEDPLTPAGRDPRTSPGGGL
jgi:ElaB/YqjD/DUF883 family membrane-anchored ribosome-binding protein